jgi:exodeoxyribonuclease V alpha subunit
MKEAVYDFICRMTGENEHAEKVAALCAETVGGIGEGDVCLALDEEQLRLLEGVPDVAFFAKEDTPPDTVRTPFVVAGGLLYTRRNWVYERRIRDWVADRAGRRTGDVSELPDDDFYAELKKNPEQSAAVIEMCNASFSILTGGPGTGKTYTIARAVKFIRDRNPDLRLGLAAPTGKAKARMMDSFNKAVGGVQIDIAPATTIHSLLKPNNDFVTFKHNRANPLPFDWLVVDEASMIDLPLMAKLIDAIPDTCRLTLVGDPDQLASVERGRVFGDLCLFPGISISRLVKSERFPSDGIIAKLAAAVNRKDGNRPEDALALLKGGAKEVSYVDLSRSAKEDAFDPEKWPGFADAVDKEFAAFANSPKFELAPEDKGKEGKPQTPVEKALAHLEDFRVLCALRHGPFGSEQIARWIKKRLKKGCPTPLMVTRNDRTLGVENGDVGVVMPDDPKVLHLPGGKTVRLELLPETELAFASTVHKAQGSDFKDVAIVLPPNPGKPKTSTDGKPKEEKPEENSFKLLTREILYTAITRTKGSVRLWASDDAILHCAGNSIQRASGLVSRKP